MNTRERGKNSGHSIYFNMGETLQLKVNKFCFDNKMTRSAAVRMMVEKYFELFGTSDKKPLVQHADGVPNIKTWSPKEPGWHNCKKCEVSARQEELEVFDGICQECYSKEEGF